MMLNGLFTQIITAVVAVAIVITYVQPALERISQIQDSIAVYQDERKKVSEVNRLLAELVSIRRQVTVEDERAILTYLPNKVDSIAVQRDLQTLAERSGLALLKVSYDSEFKLESSTSASSGDDSDMEEGPYPHGFVIDVVGDYGAIKNFLALLPTNHYPLEIHELDLSRSETGLFSASIVFVTYAFEVSEEPVRLLNRNR